MNNRDMAIAKTKILITGCGGMLGDAVYKLFQNRYSLLATDIRLNENWLTYLDIRDQQAFEQVLLDFRPDAIINLAALTDLEYCENNRDQAYITNSNAVAFMVTKALEINIPFVHISTAGIFDGNKQKYSEHEIAQPLSVYGKSKYEGELKVLQYPKGIVLRAGWMMGGGVSKDIKFVGKILNQIKAGARELFAVTDRFGTPTYTMDLARSIMFLLEMGAYGLYNGTCDGLASRYEVAKEMVDMLALKSIKIHQVDSNYFVEDYFAPRPVSEILDSSKLRELNPTLVRDWKICLKEYLMTEK